RGPPPRTGRPPPSPRPPEPFHRPSRPVRQRGPPMPAYPLQTNGAVCPFPLIDAKHAMQPLNSGDDLIIRSACTQATDSPPQGAAEDGHEVVAFDRTGDAGWTITVRKGA